MPNNFKEIEEKWIKKWEKEKIFEANPNEKPKFFVTFPYPYMNSLMHIGHFYTLMRVEAMARYKRMRGYNVLFPQGWHCTGSPIESAAQRIKENEPKQIEIMKQLGLKEEQIKEFEDPKKWVEYFPKEAEKDLKALGLSIDWRRSFITTSLNPHYDKFIKWQFTKLKEKNYVIKGSHPVVWCTKDNAPVPDHSRIEGEGETPQEFTLLKFKFEDKYIIAATLRPETVFGQTNLWVNPEIEYSIAQVDKEKWIGSKEFFAKLKEQNHEINLIGKVKGKELIGKKALAPKIHKEIIILPATFCDPTKGTGIVTSVPSDAPDDYIGLIYLQNSKETCEKYGLNYKEICEIKPIPIINSAELGEMAAEKMVKEMKIKSPEERQKLEEAKKIVYKKGYYEGTMGKNTGKYFGMQVIKAKELVKEELMKNKEATIFYELTGKVVCRCLQEAIVKIVTDQWFINYKNKEWKQKSHEALAKIKLYPEEARQQFDYVIDWLNDWPCTREFGLGTKLPWDEKWVIESLSDSTIYMAFYTIAHKLKEIPEEKINNDFFDYIFLGKESKNLRVEKNICEELRKEFNYWYPVDFRNSGKDLIQNHLTFYIFNHVAIWEDKNKHPKGIGVNGWITINGEKMSKSKGNFILLRELPEKFGCDASRFTVLSGGEGLDDANFEIALAETMGQKLQELLNQIKTMKEKSIQREKNKIDYWLESQTNEIIMQTTKYMEEAMFKSALRLAFFEMQRTIKWYLYRTGNKPNKSVIEETMKKQILMMAPITPFVAEEAWQLLEQKNMASLEQWPSYDKTKISEEIKQMEEIIKTTIEDIKQIIELTKINQPKKITIIIAPKWKHKAMVIAKKACESKTDFGAIMKALTQDQEIRKKGKEIEQFAKQALRIAKAYDETEINEEELIKENIEFFEKEFNCKVFFEKSEESQYKEKAQKAMPKKPAIVIE